VVIRMLYTFCWLVLGVAGSVVLAMLAWGLAGVDR